MPEGHEISFVTWPDGKVDERSLTVCGPRSAKERFVAAFLPADWFGNSVAGYTVDTLWGGAKQKGFRVYTIKIGEDGQPVVER